ncbi:hypothetical protein FPCIR_5910 [Fusarium pseudocircinatum]|uniref:Uncharacterized protein n=1 Tax=Fusarium pseudocircinatum TaxID=56676 RepID=A0A8H5ULE9_9HYPO|nr:hypothetical protein FPCIR_5910 [Fusarium pseudocircinatum]
MSQQLEIIALRERVAVLEGENKFVNDQNDALIENNGELGLQNDELKKDLALAEERQQRYFDFWRCAEEELTKQLELNEKLKAELEAEKSKARIDEQGEKKTN